MKTALLIIDIQNDFFTGGAMPLVDATSAAINAELLMQSFRNRELPVIFVRHQETRPGAEFLCSASGSDFHAPVRPQPGEKVVTKHTQNSFCGTDLNAYLKSERITDIVVCGMTTHNCVAATVRAARDLGYNVTVAADACATIALEFNGTTVDAQSVQAVVMAALQHGVARVAFTRDII